MDAVTADAAPAKAGAEEQDPRFRRAKEAGAGDAGREMLEHAAQGAELSEGEEMSALDWLLGDPRPIPHDIPVEFETPEGMRKLTFSTRRVDPRLIDKIELRNVGADGRVDRLTADCEIVAETCESMTDPSGRVVGLTSDEFLTVKQRGPRGELEPFKLASPALALERRFTGQQGLLTFVSAEIRRLAGYDPQRIGKAQRRLVEASLG